MATVACDGLMFHVIIPGHRVHWYVVGATMAGAAMASILIVLRFPHLAGLVLLSVVSGFMLITTGGALIARRLAARAQHAGKGPAQ